MSTAEELRAELARLESASEERATIHEGELSGGGGVWLYIAGERFECRKVSTSYQMMKFAAAQRAAEVEIPKNLPKDSTRYKELADKRNAAGMAMMATMLETINILLKPYERGRFDDFMTAVAMGDGIEPGALENAIGEVIAAVGGDEGKDQKTNQPTSKPYLNSSTTMNGTVVDSLSNKDTAEV